MALVPPQSDVAVLWEAALDNYRKTTDVDLRAHLRTQRSTTSIKLEQQRQLETFKAFRHNKGKLDRFRTMISGNADIIEGVAKHIGDAASFAFPPSSAILTAFTLVMTSSKYVSEDYDMIEGFFSMMQSFLQRLSLLENKIQPQSFQSFLINVFSSLLQLSAIARAYCAKGRISKWARALVDGNDPDLKAAYGKLNTDLQELESAIIMQTLRTTIEISDDAKSTHRDVKALQTEFGLNTNMTKQTLETSTQTLMIAMRTEEMIHTSHKNTTVGNELLRNLDKKLDRIQTKDMEEKQRNMKSGASKPVNFERLRSDYLRNGAEGGVAERLKGVKLSFVDRLFDWIEAEPAVESIVNGEESLLWVNAAPGMGKTTFSFRMLRYLEEKYSHDPDICVAWFSFDEEYPEMRSVRNMLKCCSIQVAQRDARYCKEMLIAVRQMGPVRYLETIENEWHHLIESRYKKESDRRLILILDGIDQANEEDAPSLMNILGMIKSQRHRVQIIFTCGTDKKLDYSTLGAKCVDLTRHKISLDMRRFAWSKTRSLTRLRKLRVALRKIIVRKVTQKADSFLYIDHTMRRLNTLGREGPITKELEMLADNTQAIYHNLLEECQRNRTPEDRELLGSLLAWLAYTKSKVTIAEANFLAEIISKEHAISIEEELNGRLSRLLRISGDRSVNEQDESSEDDDSSEEMSEDDNDAEGIEEDAQDFLSFQERSLKAYFRHAFRDHASALQCTATEAHAIIFQICSAILTFPKNKARPFKLVQYASEWGLYHLLEIQPDDEGSVSDELAIIILESIHSIFTNKNDSLKPLEQVAGIERTILSGNNFTQSDVLGMLSAWAKRARRLSPSQLSYEILDWFRPLEQEPLRIFIGLSRGHITNWFAANGQFYADASFISAHSALWEGRNLPELKQNLSLAEYFVDFMEFKQITERSFEVVADCFWDIVKTSSSYRGIGMAMIYRLKYGPAIKQFDKGLADGTVDQLQRSLLLTSKGRALLMLGQDEEYEEMGRTYLEQSLNTFNEANEFYRSVVQDNESYDELRYASADNFRNTAEAAALLGKSELVLRSIRDISEVDGRTGYFGLTELCPALKKTNQLPIIIELLKLATKWEIGWYMASGDVEELQEAAARLHQGQLMLKIYSTAQKELEALSLGPAVKKSHLQLSAAGFARHVLGDLELSKSMLCELVDDPKTPSWAVMAGCHRLTEILLENFRLSKDPRTKKNALDEAIKVLHKPTEVMPDNYKPSESHMMATIGYMLRHLGPALDYFEYIDAAFKNCIEELQDDSGANDLPALRRLAQVLSYISGFEKEASISLSAQLYIIDQDVHRKEPEQDQILEEDKSHASSTEEQDMVDSSKLQHSTDTEDDAQTTRDTNGDATNGTTCTIESPDLSNCTHKTSTIEIDSPPLIINEIDEGLSGTDISCSVCKFRIDRWSNRAVYFCIYCIDLDICESCFAKRRSQERGEIEPDWRVICPKSHKHIKSPMEGWRGIKDGIMRIGTEEVAFKTWLKQLEGAWERYWEEYWTDKD
ncbi:hypothetical protein LEMA_P115200.1 [Plenodomus lingam JN3]|uniref:Uncharacterized protein n=1 Tax=Leptosphaeria maculans (strain JN3 / isolate v23.1.3 / race Av1-4-5-6-7-8) TaxID=985895 RepID=E4ZUM6_LEPMJ|nr:hypothetical protein LEMA_P115200.1 [Plenodomus lingam JN3]CBX95105.1 hypothetical protein LEMA_P115200.1 [Plenodomus lingam JN3]